MLDNNEQGCNCAWCRLELNDEQRDKQLTDWVTKACHYALSLHLFADIDYLDEVDGEMNVASAFECLASVGYFSNNFDIRNDEHYDALIDFTEALDNIALENSSHILIAMEGFKESFNDFHYAVEIDRKLDGDLIQGKLDPKEYVLALTKQTEKPSKLINKYLPPELSDELNKLSAIDGTIAESMGAMVNKLADALGVDPESVTVMDIGNFNQNQLNLNGKNLVKGNKTLN